MSNFPGLFVDGLPYAESEFVLEGPEARYAARVIRVRPGEAVRLLDGKGGAMVAHVADVRKRSVLLKVIQRWSPDPTPEPARSIRLYQAVLKEQAMDVVVQKAVELGIFEIVPVMCARNHERKRAAKKIERWQRIATEAVRQCGRLVVPQLLPPMQLADVMAADESANRIFCWVRDRQKRPAFDQEGSIALVVGPEGGLTEHEAEGLLAAGFATLGLGPRVLRAETASIAALSILQHQMGDM